MYNKIAIKENFNISYYGERIFAMIILCLAILTLLFWIGYHITGALLAAIIWLCVKLPCAIIVFCFGIVCCVLILLFPIGLRCFRYAWNILT